MSPFLELDNVTRIFGDDLTTGIRGISLSISHGEYVAIVGPSGAGKSTLLNVLGLLDLPDSGTYLVDGRATSHLSERELDVIRSKNFGFIFQESHVIDHIKTINNAAMGLRQRDLSSEETGAKAMAALEKLGIGHRALAEAGTLSGGERQRLAIARAMAPGPALILADEPTGSLDTKNSERVLQDLDELHQAGTTIVLVTHDQQVAQRATRKITIVDGHVSSDVTRTAPVIVGDNTTSVQEHAEKPWRDRVLDDLGEAFTELLHKRLRTLLLSLAIALGIGGLVMSIGLSQTAANQVAERLSAAALDEVRVALPGGGELLKQDRNILQSWIDQVRGLPHVQAVGVLARAPGTTAHIRRLSDEEAEPPIPLQLVNVDREFMNIMQLESQSPVALDLLQDSRVESIGLVSQQAAKALQSPEGAGSKVRVAHSPVDIIGSFAARGRGKTFDSAVIVSAATMAKLPRVSVELLIQTEQGYPAAVAEAVPVVLDPVNPGKFGIETVADLRQLRYGVSTDLDTFVAVMSGVLLILAVISASTTMYLSVQARVSEIALRRALGMRRTGIASLFIFEGLLLGLLGGAVGVLVGAAGVLLTAAQQGWEPVMTEMLIPLGILLGAVTGLVSAIVPALIAARQEPAGNL